MFRIAAGEYDELHEAATLADPEMTLVIGFGSGGQDRNSQALMHLTSLMDDATSERWIRRLEVPGTVEWQRFDVPAPRRSEEHTSELQSLMRTSYAVFCLKKKTESKSM